MTSVCRKWRWFSTPRVLGYSIPPVPSRRKLSVPWTLSISIQGAGLSVSTGRRLSFGLEFRCEVAGRVTKRLVSLLRPPPLRTRVGSGPGEPSERLSGWLLGYPDARHLLLTSRTRVVVPPVLLLLPGLRLLSLVCRSHTNSSCWRCPGTDRRRYNEVGV